MAEKSPNSDFADADIGPAAIGAVAGIFGASGQTCIAGSRFLVERSVHDDVCKRVLDKVRKIRLGDPLDPATEMGPIANRAQFDRILGVIDHARSEGARVALGGAQASGAGLERGFSLAH